MLSKKKISALAKKLALLSFDMETGDIDLELVSEMIQITQEFHENVRPLIVRKYFYFLKMEQMNQTVKIEYASACDIEKIHAQAEQLLKRKLQFESIPVPELIAGVRITLGDQIWEYSIQNDLRIICRN